jgi:hypothetical protein
MIEELKAALVRSLKPALAVSLVVLKVFIPFSILTLILKQYGILDYFAPYFVSMMSLIGLPGEAAIVLLVGFTNTIYAALAAAAALDLTARQITILGVVLGIAHSLFIETGILANLRMATLGIALFRLVLGLASGILMNLILPELSGVVVHQAGAAVFSWGDALLDVGITSIEIAGIIFSITFGYELFLLWKGSERLSRLADFLISGIGMSGKAIAPWLIGVLVGITYGAALLYQFSEKRDLGHKDVCLVTVFLCLAHSMVEDTMIFAVVGGNFFWIFGVRIIIAVMAVRLLAIGDAYRKFLWLGLPKVPLADRPQSQRGDPG